MKQILVIEDEFDSCKLISDVLKAAGYGVLAAADGASGIQLAQDYVPDLIISDIYMPEVDGYKVLAALRRNPATMSIPFIFLSALNETRDIRSGMGLGADDYLTKPFYINDLLTTVRVRLEKQEQVEKEAEARLNELRHNIAYALPHELRTPLGIVLGYSNLLIDDVDSEQAQMIDAIIKSTNRLQKITEKFWLYAETEIMAASSHSIKSLRENQLPNAASIIQSTADGVARHFGREADLSIAIAEAGIQISERHLRQIIDEIVHNAFKFSEAGTSVEVTTSVDEKHYAITIANEGRGMTPEQIERIGAFMQFERPHYEQKGIGLGLAISRRLSELYGGTLEIENIPHERTTIIIRLCRIL